MKKTANFVQVIEPVMSLGDGMVFLSKEFVAKLTADRDYLYDQIKSSPFQKLRDAYHRIDDDITKLINGAKETKAFTVRVKSPKKTKKRTR